MSSRYDKPDAPFVSTSDTSLEAAETIAPHVTRIQQSVLWALHYWNAPVTAHAVAHVAKLEGDTVRPRLLELEKKGYIARHIGTGTSPSGNRADSWTLTDAGLAAYLWAKRGGGPTNEE